MTNNTVLSTTTQLLKIYHNIPEKKLRSSGYRCFEHTFLTGKNESAVMTFVSTGFRLPATFGVSHCSILGLSSPKHIQVTPTKANKTLAWIREYIGT